MKPFYSYKSIPISIGLKDVDQKKGIVTGYWSTFGNIDSGGDRVLPGAFSKTIAERGPAGTNKVKFLKQHDVFFPLGKPTVLKEDQKGLYFEAPISQTTWGKDQLILYADGVVDEHSFGYDTVRSANNETEKVRELVELKLWEGSAVMFGMNDQTDFTGMKSIEDVDRLFSRMDNLNRALRKQLSDETAEMLEIEVKQIEQAILNLKQSLMKPDPKRSTSEPMSEVLKAMREFSLTPIN